MDWLAGSDNKPDSATNKLSSFDLHTISPLIVSHWAAGTCHLEQSGNSQGFWRAELASCPSGNEGEASVFNAAGPCSGSLLGARRQGGFGVGLLLCSDSLIDSWLERLRVASHSTTESNPKAGVFISRISWKVFFFLSLSSLDFFFSFPSQSGQLHVAKKKVFSLNNSNFTFNFNRKRTGGHVSASVQPLNCSFNYVTLECSYLKWDALNHPGLMR